MCSSRESRIVRRKLIVSDTEEAGHGRQEGGEWDVLGEMGAGYTHKVKGGMEERVIPQPLLETRCLLPVRPSVIADSVL